MKTIHCFAAAGAVMLMLAGCSRENGLRTETVKCDESFALDSRSRDSLRVSIDIELLVAGAEAGALEKMRNAIVAALFGGEGTRTECMPSDPWQAVADFKNRISEKYRSDNLDILERYLQTDGQDAAEDDMLAPVLSWERVIHGRFLPAYGNMCSYVIYEYEYSGGAHGADKETALVFDLTTGETVSEDDIFKSGSGTAMSAALTSHLRESLDNEDDYEMLFVKEIAQNGNFYVTDQGVTYIYGRYEIGPYAMGLTRVTVPWTEIAGLLR